MLGQFNMHNALAAIAAPAMPGVPASVAYEALSEFKGIKRSLELRGESVVSVCMMILHITPPPLPPLLVPLRKRIGDKRLVAVLEPRSNTMRMGIHKDLLASSLGEADRVVLVQPADIDWDLDQVTMSLNGRATLLSSVDEAVGYLQSEVCSGDSVLIMSNGGFGGIHGKLLMALEQNS